MTPIAVRTAHALALLERIATDGHVREESAQRWADVTELAREGQIPAALEGIAEMRERGELREEANERVGEATHELAAVHAEQQAEAERQAAAQAELEQQAEAERQAQASGDQTGQDPDPELRDPAGPDEADQASSSS